MENELKKIEELLKSARVTGYNQSVLDTVDWIKDIMNSYQKGSDNYAFMLSLLDRYMNAHRKRFQT